MLKKNIYSFIKKRKSNIVLSIVVVFLFLKNKMIIANIPNYYNFLTSIQDFMMFLSGILLALFGFASVFSYFEFGKKLKQLNADLFILKDLFHLVIFSIINSAIPSILFLLDSKDESTIGRIMFLISILAMINFICLLIQIFYQVRKILFEAISFEIEKRKNRNLE